MVVVAVEPDFILFTVPHTGTFFCFGFLRRIGCLRSKKSNDGIAYRQIHARHVNKRPADEALLLNTKLLATARNPYHNILSHMSRKEFVNPKDLIRRIGQRWDYLITMLENNPNHYVIKLNEPEGNRVQHLMDAAKFVIGDDVDKYVDEIQDYALKWKPMNTFKANDVNPLIQQYVENPQILEQYDLTPLDNAVRWYNSL